VLSLADPLNLGALGFLPPTTMEITSSPRQLPNELVMTILQSLPRSDLKNARLASKSLSAMAEPHLFRYVVLMPNIQCLEKFVAVMTKSQVARHIRRVVYDCRFKGATAALLTSARRQFNETREEVWQMRISILERALESDLSATEDMAIEVPLLSAAFSILPSLCELLIEESCARGPTAGILPPYIMQLCREANLDPNSLVPNRFDRQEKLSTTAVLIAAAVSRRRILDISARNLIWQQFFYGIDSPRYVYSRQLKFYKDVMPSLRRLELSFKGSERDIDDVTAKGLAELLTPAVNLRHLSVNQTGCGVLRRRPHTFLVEGSWLTPILRNSKGVLRKQPIFPHLKTLSLNGMICGESDLTLFLRLHSRSLRQLELRDLSIFPDGADSGFPCWIRIFHAIKSFRLDSVTFGGWLSNGGKQQWLVGTEVRPSKKSIRKRMEKWIVSRGPMSCPLAHVAVKPGQKDVEPPMNGTWDSGDDSWSMTYSHYRWSDEEDDEDEDEDEDSFGSEASNDWDFYGFPFDNFWDDPFYGPSDDPFDDDPFDILY